ncbi:unnamed protein product [Pieris macdunnoughi]|uniref:Uncharacterized protein n=1 Tax=Pieris macdunnoughi TaxID=345717 RepID=A0A821S2G4_9NEOP|nr:unnamed protein product [Pieris macdunnoughi]
MVKSSSAAGVYALNPAKPCVNGYLWSILREIRVPLHLVLFIANLYQDGKSKVRVNDVVVVVDVVLQAKQGKLFQRVEFESRRVGLAINKSKTNVMLIDRTGKLAKTGPWTAKITNQSILDQLKIRTRLTTTCYKRVLTYFGLIARRKPDNLDKLFIVGKVEGKSLPITAALG